MQLLQITRIFAIRLPEHNQKTQCHSPPLVFRVQINDDGFRNKWVIKESVLSLTQFSLLPGGSGKQRLPSSRCFDATRNSEGSRLLPHGGIRRGKKG